MRSALLLRRRAALAGCRPRSRPRQHFYDQHIQPILNTFCVGNTSPCHAVDPATGTALGNLDLSSFEGVQKRRDVLRTYGSYPQPLLLLKACPRSGADPLPGGTAAPSSEIRHAGGKPIAANSDAFFELKRWLDNGANRDGIAPAGGAQHGPGRCNDAPAAGQPAIAVDTASQAYQTFVANVQPMLRVSCAFGTCHSSPQSDFYLTCGDDDEQLALQLPRRRPASSSPAPTRRSSRARSCCGRWRRGRRRQPHRRRVLPVARGRDLEEAARLGGAGAGGPAARRWPRPPGETFFEANVMPKLLQRGCALEGCHSPDGFNDFRLRSGAHGFFAPPALRRNYEALR